MTSRECNREVPECKAEDQALDGRWPVSSCVPLRKPCSHSGAVETVQICREVRRPSNPRVLLDILVSFSLNVQICKEQMIHRSLRVSVGIKSHKVVKHGRLSQGLASPPWAHVPSKAQVVTTHLPPVPAGDALSRPCTCRPGVAHDSPPAGGCPPCPECTDRTHPSRPRSKSSSQESPHCPPASANFPSEFPERLPRPHALSNPATLPSATCCSQGFEILI